MIHLSIDTQKNSAKWNRAFPRMSQKIGQTASLAFLSSKKTAPFKNKNVAITVVLSTDAMIKKLNHDFRDQNKPTNVLSFPHRYNKNQKDIYLGDIVLAFETLKRECKRDKKTLEQHTIHLVVHGVLHLLGYDHMTAKDAKNMEKLECDILSVLGYPDPYHDKRSQKKAGR